MWGDQNAVIFNQDRLQQSNRVCIFSPAYRLLDSARKWVVQAILDVWQQF